MTKEERRKMYEGKIYTSPYTGDWKCIKYFGAKKVVFKHLVHNIEVTTAISNAERGKIGNRNDFIKYEYIGQTFTTSMGEEFKIIDYKDAMTVTIEFSDNKQQLVVQMSNIKAGYIKHPKHGTSRPIKEIDYTGKTFKNARGLEYVLIKKDKQRVLAKFLLSGTTKWAIQENAIQGKVADNYAVSKLGVGIIGEPDRQDKLHAEKMQLWSNMISRCYDKNRKGTYYGKTKVCRRWQVFEWFQKDIEKLVGYDKWANKEGMELDKDILGDSTIYSPEVCIFVTADENKRAINKNKTW